MSSKKSKLLALPKPALKEMLKWLWWQHRADDDYKSLSKDEAAELICTKLDSDALAVLIDQVDDEPPYVSQEVLAQAFGLPAKDEMLASVTKTQLRYIVRQLDRQGRVGDDIVWSRWAKQELAEYLKRKFSAEELARVLGVISTPRTRANARTGSTVHRTRTSSSASGAARRSHVDRSAHSREPHGEFFGDYELVRPVSGAGMAEAFEARTVGGQTVFLKRVRLEARDQNRALEREAAIYEKLLRVTRGHEHLLEVYDWFRTDEYVALVTEFATGGDLARRIDDAGPFEASEAKSVALQVLDGLTTLHRNKVVHRDIKPQNIVLSRQRWKLADFGIAKNLDREITRHTFQQAGTFAYMPPEQKNGARADPSMDVYAFGKVLAFMLTGRTDPDGVAYPSWAALIQRCTATPPEERISTRELHTALGRL